MDEITTATIMAERFLLGAILIQSSDGDKDAIIKAKYHIIPDYFIDKRNRKIFIAMANCPDAPHIVNTTKQLIIYNNLETDDIKYLQCLISLPFNSFEYEAFIDAILYYTHKRDYFLIKPMGGVSI